MRESTPGAQMVADSTASGDAAVEGERLERRTLFVCYVLAFFSGIAALMYEVTWAKMLALTFGNSTFATTAVVAGFLGGMGIGAALYHRLRGHLTRPLALYAWIEVGIAISAALISSTFYSLPEYFGRLSATLASPSLETALHWVVVLALLLVPAVLMGATFPALCRALIQDGRGIDRHLGWIYGINTLGAAFGTLLAGLFLTERLGLRGTSLCANGINVAVALGALALLRARARDGSRQRPTAASTGAELLDDLSTPTRLPRIATGTVLLLSGFCTLGYQILWFRGLRYLLGASSYAFCIVLFTFLCGLGLGSLLLRRLAQRSAPERDLVLVQCLIAVLALSGIGLQALALSQPAIYQHFSVFVPEVRSSTWEWHLLLDLGVALLTLLPATIFMGLSFPLATRLFLGDVRRLDKSVGVAYLLANVGSILGAAAAALVLLPYFGVIGGTQLCAGLNLLAATIVAVAMGGAKRARTLILSGAVVLAAVLMMLLPRSLVLLGEQVLGGEPMEQVFFEEGDLATVQVLREVRAPTRMSMSIDGFKIGWSDGYRETPFYAKQIMLADLPLILDRRARSTLSIGFGSGATLLELSRFPTLERLECVEISASVVRGGALFPESRVLSDPRVHLFVEDAVHHLLRTSETYDLVISDGKQDPFYAGNADLLCTEFYQFLRERLSTHGMMVQWFPLGTLPSDMRIVMATMCGTFPHVDAFCFPPHSVLFVAGVEPLSARPLMSDQEYSALGLRDRLTPYGFPNSASLLSHWVAGRDRLAAAVAGVPHSRWDRQILDVSTFKNFKTEWSSAVRNNIQLLVDLELHPTAEKGPPMQPTERGRLEASRVMRQAWVAVLDGNVDRAIALSSRAVELCPTDLEAGGMLHGLRAQQASQARPK